jgi:hypothetical protein
MSSSPLPLPDLIPLTRLNVHDNLRVNAERWSLAHEYHRQRQNIYYQSLWQPGIVYGLGVKHIPAPATTAPLFRDQCWLEIQPGLAIDEKGNPIVVSPQDDRTYHLVLPNLSRPSQILHLVLRYVDPNGLDIPQANDRVLERFRFDQYIDKIAPHEIELCRITLSQHNSKIGMPPNPLQPGSNELDLRHRPQAQLRPPKWMTLGYLESLPNQKRESLGVLAEAMTALYPQLQGALELSPLSEFTPAQLSERLDRLDVAFLDAQGLMRSQQPPTENILPNLTQYLRQGGNLIIETPQITPEIQQTLQRLKRHLNLQKVPLEHEVRRRPFWFGEWPTQVNRSLELYMDEGIWLFVGSITEAWSGQGLQRHEIRSFHEWGINVLHHCWMRRHLKALLS